MPLYRQAIRAAALGLAINLALGVIKLFAGLVGNSFALLTDAVNSLGDSLTSVVVVIALHVAQRPADAEHPYGHTRAEAIAASNVALLIVLSAILLGWEALQRLSQVHAPPPAWTCSKRSKSSWSLNLKNEYSHRPRSRQRAALRHR